MKEGREHTQAAIPTKEQILGYLRLMKDELRQEGISEIGLFGSYAKDRADMASDIDIILQTSEAFAQKHGGIGAVLFLDELRMRMMREFKMKVEICDSFLMSEERRNSLLDGAIYV